MEKNTQEQLFQHIKSVLPSNLSFVDEIAAVLDISTDSAYRRIRNEKPITLEELQKLAEHFNISIDRFLHIKSDSFVFSGELASSGEKVLENWMEKILSHLTFINSFKHKHIYYLAKDLPVMSQFFAPELLAFKSFYWRRSILHYEKMRGQKFSLKHVNPRHLELGKKIEEVYTQIPTTEIWNLENINSTIRQIEFYRDANIFESEEDVKRIYLAVIRIIKHLESQAECGTKYLMGSNPGLSGAAYNFFWNELVLGDNTLLFEFDDHRMTFLNHSVINFIHTTDEKFNSHIHDVMQTLIQRSMQLSKVGERERTRFFNRILDKVKMAAMV
jgi:transcriptional regulator with XRE-family HTH domain